LLLLYEGINMDDILYNGITMNKMCLCATHIPLLVRAFELSKGDVVELGTGYFSTTILRWLCELSGRNLYSYETSPGWYERAMRKTASCHKVFKINNWDEAPIERHWGLAFIDHDPGRRRHIEIKRLANLADYIVMHDTNVKWDNQYKYSRIWDLFKYRYDCTTYDPYSSVVSNFFDLDKFKV
jgi:hypothetical protein